MSHDVEILCMDCKETHAWEECPLNGICLFCKKRKATLHFGDMLSFSHGGTENCCELCCARMQLEHAQERASEIPSLAKRVSELEKALLPKPVVRPNPLQIPRPRYMPKDDVPGNSYLCSGDRYRWLAKRALELWLRGRPNNRENQIAFAYAGHHDDGYEPANAWAWKQAREEYDAVYPEVAEWLKSEGYGV